ncbi:MAG: M15 family metallopeptidase [Cyanobacteria bacterium P01_H01_bin.58]
MKPYRRILIQECSEVLAPIPLERFDVVTPHPYEVLGASYGDRSPYWLRESIIDALLQAQTHLQTLQPHWRIQIFDAYRPLSVQQFMVDYTAQQLAQKQGKSFATLPSAEQAAILTEVYQFWALPSHDSKTPPPHSTGAAVDLTLVDAEGIPIAMGSPIDEVSARSHPDYFQQFSEPACQRIHHHRSLLRQVMVQAGFQQHPNEWWHFSKGDQLWAWLMSQETQTPYTARYGRVED